MTQQRMLVNLLLIFLCLFYAGEAKNKAVNIVLQAPWPAYPFHHEIRYTTTRANTNFNEAVALWNIIEMRLRTGGSVVFCYQMNVLAVANTIELKCDDEA